MHILYGIQSAGNGHLIKSEAVIKELQLKQHIITTLFSGQFREQHDYFYKTLKPAYQFRGLADVVVKGKRNTLRTVLENGYWQLFHDIKNFKPHGFDLIISDYEFISSWAGKRNNITTIGISRTCTFNYAIPWPKRFFLGKQFLRYSAPVDIPIGLHWYHYNQPILPPIQREDAVKQGEKNPRLILVYLPCESLSTIKKLLRPFVDFQFVIYHPEVLQKTSIDHLFLSPFSNKLFQETLSTCNGVICNAGFNLISECLTLGIKILTKPARCLIEQASNALALRELNLATTATYRFSHQQLKTWLNKENNLPPLQYPNVAKALAEWISDKQWHTLPDLSRHLWSQTVFGSPKF